MEFEDYINQNQIYKGLISILCSDVLTNLQRYLSEQTKLPVSIWAFNVDKNKLEQIPSNKNFYFFPSLCFKLHKYTEDKKIPNLCTTQNYNTILQLFEEIKTNDSQKIFESKCHLGITRLAVPLKIDDQVRGFIMIGKYIKTGEDKLIIDGVLDLFSRSKLKGIFGIKNIKQRNRIRRDLLKQVDELPVLSDSKIKEKENDILSFASLIQDQYALFTSSIEKNRSIIDGIDYLETIDFSTSNKYLSDEIVWKTVDQIFKSLFERFNLGGLKAYAAEVDNYEYFELKSYYPVENNRHKELSLSSYRELNWLLKSRRGIILPTKQVEYLWMNEHLKPAFGKKSSLLYGSRIYNSKIIIIGIGLKHGIMLSYIERILLRIAVNRIIKFIDNALEQLLLDQAMVETGHKLGRTYGTIQGSINALSLYGYSNSEGDEDAKNEIIDLSLQDLNSSLIQMDLIIHNYYSFSEVVRAPINPRDFSNYIVDKINLLDLLKQFRDTYAVELYRQGKKIEYYSDEDEYIIYSNRAAVKLLFWNLFDNAIKFSYSPYEIKVYLYTKEDQIFVQIINIGVGVHLDEKKKVFDPFYQSIYKDNLKETIGQGLGLSICKKCMLIHFPNGRISLDSNTISKKSDSRFRGDYYKTAVTVNFPISSMLFNQFISRSYDENNVF